MSTAFRVGVVGRLFAGVHEWLDGVAAAWPEGAAPRAVCTMPDDVAAARRLVAGWLLLHFDGGPRLPLLREGGRPVVGRSVEYIPMGVPVAPMGDECVGERAAAHLLPRCAGELVYLGPDATFSRRREEGFRRACEVAGRTVRTWRLDGATDVRAAVRGLPEGSGVFAVHDGAGRQVIAAALGIGRRVPGDVAVVGVDNQPWPADGPPVRLSSIPLPLREQGLRMGRMLRDLLEGRDVPARDDVLPHAVIARESTTGIAGAGGRAAGRTALRPGGLGEVAALLAVG